MKLVMANNYLYLRGGSERVMFDEAEWLRRRGHEVFLFGRCEPGSDAFPHTDLLPPLVDFSRIHGAARLGIAVKVIYNRDTGRRFQAFCGRVRPDVVHCHNIYGGLTASVIDACRAIGIPCVLTLHDGKLACPSYLMLNHGEPCHRCAQGSFYHCVLSRCHKNSMAVSLVSTAEAYFNSMTGKYRGADAVLTPSRFLLESVASAGVPGAKLRCVPNGIDTAAFRPEYSNAGYLLYAGRLAPEKGVGTLIEAANSLRVPLWIVGDGPERPALESLATRHPGSRIRFHGKMSGRDLERAFQGAAVVIVPSECPENAPMVLLEAMAYGKPVIGSRIGGIPEIIEDGRTGLLVRPRDRADLRRAVSVLLPAPQTCARMGRAARAKVEAEFSMDSHGAQIERTYEHVMRLRARNVAKH